MWLLCTSQARHHNSCALTTQPATHATPPLDSLLTGQEGCCLAFSIGVPLLGKHHRKHVHRCFSLAAQILQDLESPLARLRAQLHLEVKMGHNNMRERYGRCCSSHHSRRLRSFGAHFWYHYGISMYGTSMSHPRCAHSARVA